jgi:hypothetical protein
MSEQKWFDMSDMRVCQLDKVVYNWHIPSLNKSHGIVKKFRLAYEVVHRTVLFVLYKFGNRTCSNTRLGKLELHSEDTIEILT